MHNELKQTYVNRICLCHYERDFSLIISYLLERVIGYQMYFLLLLGLQSSGLLVTTRLLQMIQSERLWQNGLRVMVNGKRMGVVRESDGLDSRQLCGTRGSRIESLAASYPTRFSSTIQLTCLAYSLPIPLHKPPNVKCFFKLRTTNSRIFSFFCCFFVFFTQVFFNQFLFIYLLIKYKFLYTIS